MSGQAVQMGDSGSRLKPGLKDPLQSEQTPYEILGLDRGASGADAQKAFALGVGKGKNVQKLTLAKKVLQSPSERAVIDLFHYIPEWADRLAPNAILQPDILDVARRGSTAQAWEKQLRTAFPDPSAAHSLAVLWYWWAIRAEEQRSQGQKISFVIPVDQMWQKAIGCWAMFLANDDFWSGTGGISRDIATQVSAAVIDRLNGRLQELGQKHKGNGSADLAGRYQELELTLAHELRTAKQISSAGIRTTRGKVVCGLLMLQQVELLGTVRQQVESGLQRSPSSESLKKLRQALSPYSSISALIEGNKPQTALEAIDAKEKAEITHLAHSFCQQRGGKNGYADDDWSRAVREFREKPAGKELTAIRARALHFLAKQQASLNRLDDALTSWGHALECRPEAELKSNILAGIVSSCQGGVATLQQHQPEVAIASLERALRLSDDPKLRLLLAELLTNRGIRVINDAQKKAGSKGTQETAQVKADLKKAVDDLERAAKLGSKRAADQLEAARKVYEEFSSGSVLREAYEAAEREEWNTAISLLRGALSEMSGLAAATGRKNLAVCLVNRAMRTANEELSRPNPAIARRDEMFGQFDLAGSGCAMCRSSSGESWYSLGPARLCGECATKLRSAIEDASKPDPATLRLLRSAQRDLEEATQLDKTNKHAQKNLEDLRNVISQIEDGAVFGSAASPSAPLSKSSGRPSYSAGTGIRKKRFNLWSSFANNFVNAFHNPLVDIVGGIAFIALVGNSPEWLKDLAVASTALFFVFVVYKNVVSDYRNR